MIGRVTEDGNVELSPGGPDRMQVVCAPEVLVQLKEILEKTDEQVEKEKQEHLKRLAGVLEGQDTFVFTYLADMDWANEHQGGLHWDDVVLTMGEDYIYAFSFYSKDYMNMDKCDAIKHGWYREEDYREGEETVVSPRPVTTLNDVGRLVRYWINKYHPEHAQKLIYVSQEPENKETWLQI